MTEQETFTSRLRRQRQRANLSLAEIAVRTRVREDLLDALERNDLRAWPQGLYARAYVRAYATSVGLDADDTVDEFCRLFPHGDRRAGAMMRDLAAIVASESGWRNEFGHAEDRRTSPATDRRPHPRGLDAVAARLAAYVRFLTAATAAAIRPTGDAARERLRRRDRAESST